MIARARPRFYAVLLTMLLSACAVTEQATPEPTALHAQVIAAETAFSTTMADRDLNGFATFIADEAIFFAGTQPLRGREQIVAAWAQFFDGQDAPFSWSPDQVEVLQSGTLALSSGPVLDPAGKLIARFTSIWRLDPDGRWRVVFDKGCEVCSAEPQ